MIDELGTRIKEFYENRFRYLLLRRAFTILRIDGKAFHTYTKGLKRPFDVDLIDDMNATAAYLCKNIMGAKLAYVQSDEISIIVTDFDEIKTQAWFDNNLQKMCSVSSSMATRAFNEARMKRTLKVMEDIRKPNEAFINFNDMRWAEFDSRVFQIPYIEEVINYLIWRQQDATRNSISSVAQSLYSPKELNGKSVNDMQEMIFQKGQNWNDYPDGQKRGRIIIKETYEKVTGDSTALRSHWVSIDPPIFSQDRGFLSDIILSPKVEKAPKTKNISSKSVIMKEETPIRLKKKTS